MFKVGDKAMAIDTYYNPHTFDVVVRKNEICTVMHVLSEKYINIENYTWRVPKSYFINYTKLERKQKLEKICSKQEI